MSKKVLNFWCKIVKWFLDRFIFSLFTAMKPEILMYSTDENLTFGDIKNLKSTDSCISISDLQKTQDIFVQNHIQASLLWEESYHTKFLNIPNKPYIMHYIWDISLLDHKIFGIVWPRKPSDYSHQLLQKLFDIAKNYDLVTISGMADGVDLMCHSFSVKYNIPTIAVLGGGLYHYLRSPSRHIIESIVEHGGLVLSEYKINFAPTKYSFPQRNRIVAWLCDMLFLPEAGEWSGSLITANFAYNQNKPVYVAPWNIFSPTSIWVNQLVNDKKATYLTDFQWLFSQNFFKKCDGENTPKYTDLPPEESEILSLLSTKWQQPISQIVEQTSIDIDTLMTHITLLEMNDFVYQNSPGVYSLR